MEEMESTSRGQPPAWHTKVVNHDPGCRKAGSCDEEVCDCSYDGMSSKPGPTVRGIP